MPGHDKVRALVLSGFGLNCDNETAHALDLAGAAASIVHISDLTGTTKRNATETLDDYQILVFDGGFAWGDDHGAGVLLATRLGNHLNSQLRSFLDRGGLVLGICNGFQALVNLGLLPMLRGWERQVALIANDCGNFQDRWVELLAQENSPCLFTKGLSRVDMPVRHGEGKFVCDDDTLQKLEDLGMVAVRYGDGRGKPAQGRRPANPNGSLNDIAGICDPSGRVFGLMPHPEGYYRASQHPDWTLHRERARRNGQEPDPLGPGLGLAVFTNAVAAAQETLA
ncbi:MAG: phosphoribosylformylglycinamidine synthase subunit PurQ [Proteobacteria bacterium]|nr:phosphoribosylformylglycinamidine synthase subunit PurQ [Pseudomonadota bacterium]MBU4603721.1 phosphoribosylformylglycinamidine synthase subunit PurQ [Pseudomonadota bacterium]MCG2766484.1 phosphoribosylformylglycinamidine synthase subunit PurQ [Desulfarculaceae bacterium]